LSTIQQLEIFGPSILDVVAIALRHVADVAGIELLGADAAVGAEHGHAGAAGDVVLPLVGIGVPMWLAQAARFDAHESAGHGGRDREFALRYQTTGA
jgi:hypothetical protein